MAKSPIAKAKAKAVATQADKSTKLTAAQERFAQKLQEHATAELDGAKKLYNALVSAAKGSMAVDGIVLAVKTAYERAGASEASARVRASEAKKVVLAIRNEAPDFTATDYDKLQKAAAKAPAATNRGATSGKGKRVPTPMACLTKLEESIDALKESLPEDSAEALDMVGELVDMAESLSDLILGASEEGEDETTEAAAE